MKKDAHTYEYFVDGRMKRWTNAKREKANYTFYICVYFGISQHPPN